MKYCKKCILPDTRPNINFNEDGICDACCSSEQKINIDWPKRESQFNEIVKNVKSLNKPYDCVIPVSGGKDSTWQTLKALEYGLNPLCVTWKSPARNELGQRNLDNLINLGVNHIDFSINEIVEKEFTLKAFKRLGSPVIPMHMALHAIPLQIAVNFEVPLIIWGENSASEYGGDDHLKGTRLNHEWLKKYGVTNGTTSMDWHDDFLNKKNMKPYEWPSDSMQEKSGVKAIFLGSYFEWDPVETFNVAKNHGFREADKPKTGLYNFADVDDAFLITIHHYMKWYKFGFTRLWDNLSIEIRNNRMTRKEAISIVKNHGNDMPIHEINEFCDYLDLDHSEFINICDSFRNHEIWHKDNDKNWKINNFLIENWKWDEEVF